MFQDIKKYQGKLSDKAIGLYALHVSDELKTFSQNVQAMVRVIGEVKNHKIL